MKALLSTLLLFAAAFGLLRADAPPPPAPPVGIIILKAIAGYDAAATWFTSIQWVDKDSGYVIDPAGKRLPFLNDAIGRVIYFDGGYYDEVDHNQYWIDWRAVVRSREAVLAPIQANTLWPSDSSRLASEQAVLQEAIGLYPNGATLVQPLIDTLKGQIAKLNNGLVLQNGAWVAAKDVVASTSAVPVVGESEEFVTFTTKDGKRFDHAKVTVTDSGLSVLTSDGGASVPFENLPDDISAFPKTVRDKIVTGRAAHAQAAVAAASSSASGSGWLDWISDLFHAMVSDVSSWIFQAKSSTGSGLSAASPASTPDDATAINNRGMAKRDKRDLDGAIADFTQAIALDPKVGIAYNNRGMAKRDEGDQTGAIADFTEAIAIEPKDAIAYSNRGLAKMTLKDLDGALSDENQAVQLDPNNAKAYNNRGLVKHEKGDQDGAITDFNKAIALDPAMGEAFNNRGLAEKAKGDVNGAASDFNQALTINPNDTKAKAGANSLKLQP